MTSLLQSLSTNKDIMRGATNLKPIVSKLFCDSFEVILLVRKRPHMINGGGFVVMDCNQKVVFSVDGCGVLGINGKLIVRDGDGTAILFITKKGGFLQALSFHNKWKGYMMDYGTPSRLVFTSQPPKSPLIKINAPMRIILETNGKKNNWDFELVGSFIDRACTLKDRKGNVIAQIGAKEIMGKEFYNVVVEQGHDQAFVIGVLAILDNINGEATRC